MNLKQEFSTSYVRSPEVPPDLPNDFLLGYSHECKSPLYFENIFVLSHGSFADISHFSYNIKFLNCHMLFVVKEGCLTLSFQGQILSLKKDSLFLFDARQTFSLQSDSASANFSLYYLYGTDLHLFSKIMSDCDIPLSLTNHPQLAGPLRIIEQNENILHNRNCLLDIRAFTDLFTEIGLMSHTDRSSSKKIPSYLEYMKKCFDFSYDASYSLQGFEDELQISKYRLCHEFTKYFGSSPLQYLNKHRIEAAKDLLISTDLSIHEVGSRVGIENTNHFIHIFKKDTGTTPFVYRKQMW